MADRTLTYLQLIRLPAVFTALSNILAAHLIATQGSVRWTELSLLLVASGLIYSAGMVLNDCFDLEQDRRERPSRPLPSKRISVTSAWRIGWSLLAGGILMAGLAGLASLVIAMILAGAVLLYDGLLKETFAASLAMGSCRYLNWLLGLSIIPLTADACLIALPIFSYILALTILSEIETGEQRQSAIVLCAGGILLTLGLIAGLHALGILHRPWVLVAAVIPAIYLLVRLASLYRSPTPGQVQGTVKLLILGIIPLDAILVFAGGPWWGGVAVLGLMIPAAALGRVMYLT